MKEDEEDVIDDVESMGGKYSLLYTKTNVSEIVP